MLRRAALRLLPSPSLARSTILARITSRYGDVYSLTRASSSTRSSLVSSITEGLRLGIPHPPRRGGACYAVTSRPKIRHRIFETGYLGPNAKPVSGVEPG